MEEYNELKKFLHDTYSTIIEIFEYLNPTSEFYNFIVEKTSSKFSVETIINLAKKIKDNMEEKFLPDDIDSNNVAFFKILRHFIDSDLKLFINVTNSFLNKLLTLFDNNLFDKSNWEKTNPITLFSASVLFLQLYYRRLKNITNKYFITGFKPKVEIKIVSDTDEIWDVKDMKYIEFNSDITKLREYTNELLQNEKTDYVNDMIFRLQVSEFIKNGIRHGNKLQKEKKVKVWYKLTQDYTKFIFEDEGDGFKNVAKWNEFNKKRLEYLMKQDITNALKYAVFRTEESIENDGGNFLFSAMEYWDSGLILNTKKNKIYVMRYFY